MGPTGGIKVFSGTAHRGLAEEICRELSCDLGKATTSRFSDGEFNFQIEENVRGADCFIVQPTCPPTDAYLMELLVMLDAFRRSSAARTTAVLPYYGYGRADKKDRPRVPITAKLVANLISQAGANRVLTMDLHAAQIQGFFDVPVDHLYAAPILDQYFVQLKLPPERIALVAPDEGSIKRTLQHVEHLGGTLTIVDKRRSSATLTRQANLIGEPIAGKIALLFDDMISTAGSIVGAANVVKSHGAAEVYLCATHPVFCGPAIKLLREAPVKEIVITNSIPLAEPQLLPNVKVVSVAPLLGEAIKRIHRNESVSYLFD